MMVALATLLLLLDFGRPDSPVQDGWQALTPTTVATATAAGWAGEVSLQTVDHHFEREVENVSRGTSEPPSVYTNPLLQDAIVSDQPAVLRLPLTAGDYELWLAAGVNAGHRYQVFDFDVTVGQSLTRFQMVGDGWRETRRIRFQATGPTDVVITPRSKWAISGLACYPAASADEVAASHLAEHDSTIYWLPPDLMEKWTPETLGEVGLTMPSLTRFDLRRGYLIHHRHYLENVFQGTVPYESELNPVLRAFASLGEFEPLTFTILPLDDLAGCQVFVTPLRGPGTIPAEAIDIKQVQYQASRPNYTTVGRYHIVPDHLRDFASLDLPSGQNQRFWLTVKVPEGATPGLYRGEVRFVPNGAPPTSIPIEFRVLPIRLQSDPEKVFGMYYRDPLDNAARATDDYSRQYFERQAELEGQDFLDHGHVMNVPLSAWIAVPTDPATPIDHQLDWDHLARRIERCGRYGYAGPFVMSLNTGGLYRRHQGESYGSHLRGAKACPEAFEAELTAMIQWIEAGRRERGLPEFLYYPVDEPGREAGSVAFMVQCLRAIQAAGARTYVTADPTHTAFDPMRPFINVWCTQPFLPERDEILADTAAREVEYWCYPNHINGENNHTTVAGARMTYGFGFWRSGFTVLIPWIYSSTRGHPFNNLDSPYQDFFNRPGPDGTVWPVPMWEAYREGVDDYRYVYTLTQLIGRARGAGHGQLADTAQTVLDRIWNAIDVKAKYKEDRDVWGYREFDLRRWQIAEQILVLQSALGLTP